MTISANSLDSWEILDQFKQQEKGNGNDKSIELQRAPTGAFNVNGKPTDFLMTGSIMLVMMSSGRNDNRQLEM